MAEMKACGPKVYESIKRKVTDLADTDGARGGGAERKKGGGGEKEEIVNWCLFPYCEQT